LLREKVSFCKYKYYHEYTSRENKDRSSRDDEEDNEVTNGTLKFNYFEGIRNFQEFYKVRCAIERLEYKKLHLGNEKLNVYKDIGVLHKFCNLPG